MRVQIKKGAVKVVPTEAATCQMLFCLKEKNQKRINSHRWALEAFGRVLDPAICVFIDIGTEPEPGSILHLWNAFDQHPSCGSVSGVTKVLMNPKHGIFNNPLLAAQNFEYKMWNILDRPFDSFLGLRFDMPGAMLAYRYIALQNNRYGDGPLKDYFALESNYSEGVFTMNMSLTEERGLSFALITKRNCNWDLRYEYAASATVDVPEIPSAYVLQRRRWVNGTFFGSIYAITNIYLIFRSGHEARRKLLLFVQCIYQTIALLYSWFSIVSHHLSTCKACTNAFKEQSILDVPCISSESSEPDLHRWTRCKRRQISRLSLCWNIIFELCVCPWSWSTRQEFFVLLSLGLVGHHDVSS
jgi:chitin synthase